MDIIETRETLRFNPEEIHERDLVRAKYHTWDEPRNGIVTVVRGATLTVLFLPEIHRATTYFVIRAEEVRDGKWEMTYTQDFTHIGKVEMTDGDGGGADS